MKKETLLTISVVLLLLLNFGTLAYLFTAQQQGPPPPPDGPRGNPVDRIIRGTLHFTEKQDQQFRRMKHEHHEAMLQLDGEYQHVLLNYFDLLKDTAAVQQQKDSLQQLLSRIQIQKATVTYNHFKDLKEICTPEQKKRFDSILPEIMQVISPRRPHGPPPHE